jgi:hypothetical protein
VKELDPIARWACVEKTKNEAKSSKVKDLEKSGRNTL